MYLINVKIPKVGLNDLRDFMRTEDIRLVLFADTHGYFDEIPVERKIMEIVRPDFFLYEMLENRRLLDKKATRKFLDKPDKERFSFISVYKDLKPTVGLAYGLGLPIIGCDIKNMDQTSVDWIKRKFSRQEARELTEKRELRQAKVINSYSSKGIVFASLGAYHLRRGSITVNNLRDRRFLIVSPTFGGRESYLIPADTKEKIDGYSVRLRRTR